MTASITICNTSNATGEEYHITINNDKVVLKPGESVVAYHDAGIDVDFEQSGKPEPFRMDGTQMIPVAHCCWKKLVGFTN